MRCAKCQTTLRVPEPAMATAGAATSGGGMSGAAPPLRGASRPVGGKRYGFNCQYCSSRLEATEQSAGQEGMCPTCGNSIIIPILDRYGRLIDPMTGTVVKPDPHPVHAYAANGERAPQIVKNEAGSPFIQCAKCKTLSPISSNNCKKCGMPFTMEGTTVEAAGNRNGFAVAGLTLGILSIPLGCTIIVPVIGLLLSSVAIYQTRETPEGGRTMAIVGLICSLIGCGIAVTVMH